MKDIFAIILLFGLQVLISTQKLVYVQQVFRHGHRYPIYGSTVDGSDFIYPIKSSGQLTRQGKSMHYILGQQLYKQYWADLFGGTPHQTTYNQSKFYVKSTNVNRTIESVQSQLLGIFESLAPLQIQDKEVEFSLPLWPEVTREKGDLYTGAPKYHAVPIHVEKGQLSPWDNGDFLRIYSSQFCPNQNIWQNANKRDQYIISIVSHPNITNAINALNRQFKTNYTFWDIYKLYDNAVCMRYDGRTIKSIWTDNTEVKRGLDVIYVMDLYMKMFNTEQQLATTATGYFNETYHNFKRVTADQSGVQWAFYSAHDTTVGNFMARLNLTNPKCIFQNFLKNITKNSQSDTCVVEYPGYTSNLIFQVYKYSNSNFTFKIRLNGNLRKIPFCDWKLECDIKVYYSWFESWKNDDYVATCGVIDTYKTDAETNLTFAVIQFGILICFFISLLYNYLHKKHQTISVGLSNDDKKDKTITNQISKEQPNLHQSLISEE